MIKNERQYRITRAQDDKFKDALARLRHAYGQGDAAEIEAHPLLRQAQEDSLRSQWEELNEQLAEFEALRSGKHSVLEVNSFEELPRALIRARIASGMSQREFAERLGLKEQQVQRYEATEYASASIDRIKGVIRVLGITVREDIFLPNCDLSLSTLYKRLQAIGLSRDFVRKRLLPPSLLAQLESPEGVNGNGNKEGSLVVQAASRVARVFGWSPVNVLSPDNRLDLNMAAMGSVRFKLPAQAEERRLSAYTVYAHILALLVLDATHSLPRKPIPTDAAEVRDAVISAYGAVTFETMLRYVWSIGVPVLPLNDAGAFHGACWRVEGRNIIVIKQGTKSASRWLFDLSHEVRHAGQEPDRDELTIIEENENAQERRESEEEQEASEFAGDVVLDGRAEELVEMCVEAARNDVKLLKSVLPRIARREQVSVSSLANYMAFRLSLQNYNWWGAATNLQEDEGDPWQIARDILLERANLSVLNEFDRELLQQALLEDSLVAV